MTRQNGEWSMTKRLMASAVAAMLAVAPWQANAQPMTMAATTIAQSEELPGTLDLTLAESIQMALENNRAIKKAMTDWDNAKWARHEVRRQSGLSVSWQGAAMRLGGHSVEDARRAEPITGIRYDREYSHAFVGSFPLYTGGQLENLRRAAGFGVDVAELTLEATRQGIRASTTEAYFRILQCRNMVAVNQEAVDTLTAHLNNVQAHYRVGMVAKSDVLRSQVELANAQQALVLAQNDYDIAVATFNNIIGLPTETNVNASEELTYTEYELTLRPCTEYALWHRPDGIAADRAVSAQQANMNAEKSGYQPKLSAQAQRSLAGDAITETNHKSGDAMTVGVVASWNIFDNNVTGARVAQQKASLMKAEETAAETYEQIQLDVQTAYLNLMAAAKNIATTSVAVEQAREDYKIAQVRYTAGVGTNVDVMDAEQALISAQTTYVSALYKHNVSKASLDWAMGIKVELDVSKFYKRPIPEDIPVKVVEH